MKDHRAWELAIERTFELDDPEAARELMSSAQSVSYEAEQRIFECGAPADEVILMLSGEVDLCLPVEALSSERGVKIDRVGEGAIIGWSAITNPFLYVLSAWAVGPVEVLAFAPDAIAKWCEANPKAGLRLQRKVANVIGGRLASIIRALRGEIEHSIHQKRRGAYE